MPIRKHLTDEEFEHLKEYLAADDSPRAKLLELITLTGMRQCEALMLEASSLDKSAQCLKVRAAKDSFLRLVPLAPAFMERVEPFFLELYARGARGGTFFSDSLALRTQARSLERYWRNLSEHLFGEYVISLHGLRHSFIGRVFQATGNDLLKTQRLVGHKSVNNTIRYLTYFNNLDARPDVLKANGDDD